MEVYKDQRGDMKWSYGNILTCLLIDPKSDSLVSKVVQKATLLDWSTTMEESYTQAILRKSGCYRMCIDTHLLEMKVEATYGTKDDPVSSQNQGVPRPNPKT
jgi:hypothetical protein